MTLAEVAEVVGGTAHGEATVSGGAFVDTRTPEPAGLYVAVAGARVDGHDLAGDAVAAGAAAVLGTRATRAPTVVVDDVVAALGLLARHVLDQIGPRHVLAMTGSQGKTGTKDYLAAIMSRRGPTVATRGNHNNELGVPLTVLRADAGTDHLVVEMGARGIGHVAQLCRIAPPTVAAVLNVGSAHVGEFGSREAIAQAKGEIVEALPVGGTAVLNADDPLVAPMAARTSARVLTWGRAGDLRAESLSSDDLGRHRFDLVHGDDRALVRLRQVGAHQVLNAQAAAAMALAAGVPLAESAAALSDAVPTSRWRMEVVERGDGLVVLNDAYNANPESMEAALETLALVRRRGAGRRRTVAVLGEMYELGEGSAQGHRRVGRAAAAAEVDVLVTVGEMARDIAAAAAEQPAWAGQSVVTGSREEAVTWLRHNVSAADVILLKASRGAALEVIVDQLIDDEGTSNR